ncbi:MAG: hypothetical protein R3B70_06120 [Polyangiaceae bacterium]
MDLRARLLDVKRNTEAAVWRLRTSARVMRSTGIARAATPAGLVTVARGRRRAGG